MKKIISIMLTIVMVISLFGCTGNTNTETHGHDHEHETTAPVETTQPTETLSACEANGHTWVDATCETAKTCEICGETEGEALGHDMAEANYQAPATCKTCGYTEGEALVADFDKYGLNVINAEIGVEYDYITTCYQNTDAKTTGKLVFSDYAVFDGDETHEALEGYEWHTVTATIAFSDKNAQSYGMSVKTCRENYYDILGWDASAHEVADGVNGYTVKYNGVEYTDCLFTDSGIQFGNWKNKVCEVTVTAYWRVPVGYDGLVFGFYDASIEWGDGQHIFDIADENTVLFRFAVTEDETVENNSAEDTSAETQPVETEPAETKPVETEHKHSYSSKTTKATCESKGYTTYTCACGDSYKSDYTDATGHKYKTTTVEPTTDSEGYDLHECKNCGKSYKDNYVDKLSDENENDGYYKEMVDDGDTGFYWSMTGIASCPYRKIYHDCATQGHVDYGADFVTITDTCDSHIVEYTCAVVGCDATWREELYTLGHCMDESLVSHSDTPIYYIRCNCHKGFRANTRELAMEQWEAHLADGEYNGVTDHQIMMDEIEYPEVYPETFKCKHCGQTVVTAEVKFYVD